MPDRGHEDVRIPPPIMKLLLLLRRCRIEFFVVKVADKLGWLNRVDDVLLRCFWETSKAYRARTELFAAKYRKVDLRKVLLADIERGEDPSPSIDSVANATE